jgi:hypothetical protein
MVLLHPHSRADIHFFRFHESLILLLVEKEGILTGDKRYRIRTRYTHEELAAMIGAGRRC